VSQHRAPVRPRYGRLAALGLALSVTMVAVLGGAGLLPVVSGGDGSSAAASVTEVAVVEPTEQSAAATGITAGTSADLGSEPAVPALPAGSGDGKRIVFSEGQQRVWLVGPHDGIKRTYLVSGSVYDNLDPGTYSVYSRSEQAWGIDDSGTMKYFVRFAQGDNAAIGFHDIPIDDEVPVQTVAQLGTPLSHGCIRQKRSDAMALWEFAAIVPAWLVRPLPTRYSVPSFARKSWQRGPGRAAVPL